ncbi:OPT super [Ascochyta clinopodiicola]|nr:OPT super [Ascochyta clinopodiicola]
MTKRLLDGNMLSVNTWGSRKSVLHLAAGLNDIDLLLRILRHEDFDSEILTATDYDGATPLDIASSKDNVAIMDLLISHGAPDTRTKPDQRSRSGDEPTHNKMSKSYDDSESDDDFEIES